MGMDLSKLSDAQIEALATNDFSKLSDQEFMQIVQMQQPNLDPASPGAMPTFLRNMLNPIAMNYGPEIEAALRGKPTEDVRREYKMGDTQNPSAATLGSMGGAGLAMAVPIPFAGKFLGAKELPKNAGMLAKMLNFGKQVGKGSALGGTLGALANPGEGQTRVGNAKLGAAVGGGLPVLGAAAEATGGLASTLAKSAGRRALGVTEEELMAFLDDPKFVKELYDLRTNDPESFQNIIYEKILGKKNELGRREGGVLGKLQFRLDEETARRDAAVAGKTGYVRMQDVPEGTLAQQELKKLQEAQGQYVYDLTPAPEGLGERSEFPKKPIVQYPLSVEKTNRPQPQLEERVTPELPEMPEETEAQKFNRLNMEKMFGKPEPVTGPRPGQTYQVEKDTSFLPSEPPKVVDTGVTEQMGLFPDIRIPGSDPEVMPPSGFAPKQPAPSEYWKLPPAPYNETQSQFYPTSKIEFPEQPGLPLRQAGVYEEPTKFSEPLAQAQTFEQPKPAFMQQQYGFQLPVKGRASLPFGNEQIAPVESNLNDIIEISGEELNALRQKVADAAQFPKNKKVSISEKRGEELAKEGKAYDYLRERQREMSPESGIAMDEMEKLIKAKKILAKYEENPLGLFARSKPQSSLKQEALQQKVDNLPEAPVRYPNPPKGDLSSTGKNAGDFDPSEANPDTLKDLLQIDEAIPGSSDGKSLFDKIRNMPLTDLANKNNAQDRLYGSSRVDDSIRRLMKGAMVDTGLLGLVGKSGKVLGKGADLYKKSGLYTNPTYSLGVTKSAFED